MFYHSEQPMKGSGRPRKVSGRPRKGSGRHRNQIASKEYGNPY